jgi:hypothetical protein
MNDKAGTTPQFLTQAKKLSKKYSTFRDDLATLTMQLAPDPTRGTSLDRNCYKIRLAVTAKGKKSGVRGSSPVLEKLMKQFTLLQLVVNPKRKT